jgi:hypothetical protein
MASKQLKNEEEKTKNEIVLETQDIVCIECGNKIDKIFKIYKDGFKDIVNCVTISSFDPFVNDFLK